MKKFTLALFILSLVISCSKKIKVIPEISDSLRDEVVLDLKDEEGVIQQIIKSNSEIVFLTNKGKIFKFNPEQKIINFLYDLITEIETAVFSQEEILVIKKANENSLILFNLQEMRVLKTIDNIKTEKIISVDKDYISYTLNNKLVFFNHFSEKITKTIDLDETDDVFNGEIFEKKGQILVLSSQSLFVFSKGPASIKTFKLKLKACSGFLLKGESIFYGSENRYLVKLGIKSNKIDWKFELGDKLTVMPVDAGSFVAVVPEDNNIYFFNKNGTLHWWAKLNSSRAMDPIKMKENIALFLWDNSFKFFNYNKKKIISFPFYQPIYSDPVYINEYLFVISHPDLKGRVADKHKCIIKIGNNYGVAIEVEPEQIIPINKSVRFNISEINLIKPDIKVKIINPSGQSVYDKVISEKDDTSFIWIPKSAATYRVMVEIEAKNKQDLIIEKPIRVIDVEKILERYYYFLHKQSNEDKVRMVPFQ